MTWKTYSGSKMPEIIPTKEKTEKKKSVLRTVLFNLGAGKLIAVGISFIILIIFFLTRRFFAGRASSGSVFFIFITFLLIFFNGWALMHRNGIDFSTIFFYALVVTHGSTSAISISLIAAVLVYYLGTKSTPIDFLMEKSIINKTAQLIMLLCVVLFVGIANLFGLPLTAFSTFLFVFIAARIPRMFILVLYGRAPILKVFVSNGVGIIINYYLGLFLLNSLISYASSFV